MPMAFAEEDFQYSINNGKVTIEKFKEELSGFYNIPEKVDGYPVTEISDNAFSYYETKIKTIYIPETVEILGDMYAPFRDIDTLERIIVDDDNNYFVSDENGVLYTKDKTELLQYPRNCKVEDFVVPDGVEFFRTGAFNGAYNLKSVVIPASGRDVGGNDLFTGFYNCKKIEKIIVDADNQHYSSDENGALYNKNKSILYYYPSGNIQPSFTLPDSVKGCYMGAFNYCQYLERINLNKVEKVYNDVFVRCVGLKEIYVSKSTTSFNNGTFNDCHSFKTITFAGTESRWNKILKADIDNFIDVICLEKESKVEKTTVPETQTKEETTVVTTQDITTEKEMTISVVSETVKENNNTPKYIIIAGVFVAIAGAVVVVVFKNKKK